MIEEKIKIILEEVFNHKSKNFNLDLIDSNIIDSFGLVSLIIELEKIFKIKINRSKLNTKDFRTINNLKKFIKKKLNKKIS